MATTFTIVLFLLELPHIRSRSFFKDERHDSIKSNPLDCLHVQYLFIQGASLLDVVPVGSWTSYLERFVHLKIKKDKLY